jgi:hypothetical protein
LEIKKMELMCVCVCIRLSVYLNFIWYIEQTIPVEIVLFLVYVNVQYLQN